VTSAAARADEVGGEVEVAALARVAVQLDERRLDLRVAGRAVAGAEHVGDVVGEAARHAEQALVAPSAGVGDRGLGQVAGAIELVVPGEVGEARPGPSHLVVGVQVAAFLLCGLDQRDRVVRAPRQILRRLAGELPAQRLEPLVDVGVHEHHPAELGVRPPRRRAQVLEVAGLLEPVLAVEQQPFAVEPLAVGPEAGPDASAAEWTQPCVRRAGEIDRAHLM
jgi:hypothetical protein